MDFSSLKGELEQVFTEIQEQIQDGDLPSDASLNQFIRLTRQLHSNADEAWADECEDFLHLSLQLQHACKRGLIQDATRLVDSLDDARSYCHRTFKDM